MRTELLKSLGWGVFVGGGVALGLALGSLGADVPADGGMLFAAAVVGAVTTFVLRSAMAAFKLATQPGRGSRPASAATPAPADRSAPRPVGVAEALDADDEIEEPTPPARAAKRAAPKRAAKRAAPKRAAGSTTGTGADKRTSGAKRTPAAKRTTPAKRSAKGGSPSKRRSDGSGGSGRRSSD